MSHTIRNISKSSQYQGSQFQDKTRQCLNDNQRSNNLLGSIKSNSLGSISVASSSGKAPLPFPALLELRRGVLSLAGVWPPFSVWFGFRSGVLSLAEKLWFLAIFEV